MKLKVLHSPLHNANLVSIPYWEYTKNLYKTFIFTEESKYETKNPKDQADWNKLTGLASHLFNSQKSSHMWAWRYYKGNFEIAPYSHNANGDKILPLPQEITTVPMGIRFDVMIHLGESDSGKIRFFAGYKDENDEVKMFKIYTTNLLLPKKKYRVIQSWFGGDSLPKKTVKVYGE